MADATLNDSRSPDELSAAVDRCAYCHDQCMAGTPEILATKDQAVAVSRVASLLRARRLGDRPWDGGLTERIFIGLNDGLQFEFCIYHDDGHRIEPYLRAARREAIAAGFSPPSVDQIRRAVIDTGNIFGITESLMEPVVSVSGTPILVHDAACRFLLGDGLAAARDLLRRVDGQVSELAVASSGAVELDLGLTDLAQLAAERMVTQLRAMPAGPIVTIDATVALALRDCGRIWGLEVDRPVIHLSQYLADNSATPRGERRVNVSVVYHDSGALARGLGIVDEPRALLRGIAGGGLREAVPAGRRASSDGPLAGYPRPDIALSIAQTRSRELVETGADCIVTACPYSLRNLRAADPPVPIVDLWSLLAAAWDERPEEAVQALLEPSARPAAELTPASRLAIPTGVASVGGRPGRGGHGDNGEPMES